MRKTERYHSASFSEATPESSESSSTSPIETIEEIQASLDTSELLKHQLLQAKAEIARHNEQTILANHSRKFCLENMTEDDSISFYTGFPNMHEDFPGKPNILKCR